MKANDTVVVDGRYLADVVAVERRWFRGWYRRGAVLHLRDTEAPMFVWVEASRLAPFTLPPLARRMVEA